MVKKVTLEDEFQKNKDLKKEDLQNLKDWYMKQAHLPPIPDELLVLFFHSCYFKMEPTKITIDNYFSCRTHVPEFFTDRDPFKTDLVKGKPVVRMFMLNGTTPDGCRVIYTKLGNPDPSVYSFASGCKSFTMHSDLELYLNGTSSGFIICFNMQDIAFGHVTKLYPVIMKKIFYYLQEAMPVRLRGLHFVNVVPFMDTIMNLMKPFLKKELLEVMHLHTQGIESLYKYVPKKMLPSDLGGEFLSEEEATARAVKLLQDHEKFFEEEAKLRVDESKRVGKAKSAGDIFGMEGSFKKLDLD